MTDEAMWRTPDAPGSGGPRNRQGSVGAGHQITIAEQAERFDVGHAALHHGGGGESLERKQELGRTESGGGDLQAQAEQLWQTPATDSFRSRSGDRKDEMGLDQQARIQWPTPNSKCAEDSQTHRSGERAGELLLTGAAQQFPTPASRDYRSPNLTSYSERGGQMKGEQLQNFVEHSLFQDQPTLTDGRDCSPSIRNSSPPGLNSTGSAMDSETLVYFVWARRAWSRQGRIGALPSSATGSEAEDSEDSSEAPSRESERERKQKKLWAYRQRTMGWSNPLKWTRTAFRRRLNESFVESLMTWPPEWTSAQTACGPEVMALWASRALLHLSCCAKGQ